MYSDKVTVKGQRVIVAMAPALTSRIIYEPGMPPARDQLTQRYPQGTLTKVAAVYPKPFWRDQGLTGQALDTGGPVSAIVRRLAARGHPGGAVRLRRR